MVSTCHSKLWQYHCKGGKVPGVWQLVFLVQEQKLNHWPHQSFCLCPDIFVFKESQDDKMRHKDFLWWSSSWSPLRNESLVKNYLWAIFNCHAPSQALHSAHVPISQSQVGILRGLHTETTNTGKTSWCAIQKIEHNSNVGNAAASSLILLSFALCFP